MILRHILSSITKPCHPGKATALAGVYGEFENHNGSRLRAGMTLWGSGMTRYGYTQKLEDTQ
ncbi:MAG: hypothetical protein COA84_12605 [Robiginitomaculum sp.]|nr:MAG: hypothetical protein COA84_12605 [Robiginitomaculum sp.]